MFEIGRKGVFHSDLSERLSLIIPSNLIDIGLRRVRGDRKRVSYAAIAVSVVLMVDIVIGKS